jgi:hypothetical protein
MREARLHGELRESDFQSDFRVRGVWLPGMCRWRYTSHRCRYGQMGDHRGCFPWKSASREYAGMRSGAEAPLPESIASYPKRDKAGMADAHRIGARNLRHSRASIHDAVRVAKPGELRVGDHVATARSMPVRGLARSDIYWDRIVSIEPAGDKETYDLKIEGDHNFVANHFVVHNSHSASFALLVYTSAWIKHYEPAAFCAALINSQPMGFYAPAQLVRDARAHGVEVRPVAVDTSAWDCTLERREDGRPALRLGLRMVKHLSEEGAKRLVAARAVRPFTGLEDLAERASLDRRDLEALAAGDALAGMAGHRYRAYWQVSGWSVRCLCCRPKRRAGGHTAPAGATRRPRHRRRLRQPGTVLAASSPGAAAQAPRGARHRPDRGVVGFADRPPGDDRRSGDHAPASGQRERRDLRHHGR